MENTENNKIHNDEEETFIKAFDCPLKELESQIKKWVLNNNISLNKVRVYSNIGYNNQELYAVADLYLIKE